MSSAAFTVALDGLVATFRNQSPAPQNIWDFGDGQVLASESAIHAYRRSGQYSVSLTVIDDAGADTAEKTITVVEDPLEEISFAFPLVFPVKFGHAGQTYRTERLRYEGSWLTRPAITLYGPYAGASVKNTATGIGFAFIAGIGEDQYRHVTWDANEQAWFVIDEDSNYVWHELAPDSNLLDFAILPEHLVAGNQHIQGLISGGSSMSKLRIKYHQRDYGI